MKGANAQWVRECAGIANSREVTVIKAKERPSSAAGFQLPPRAGPSVASAASPTGDATRRRSRDGTARKGSKELMGGSPGGAPGGGDSPGGSPSGVSTASLSRGGEGEGAGGDASQRGSAAGGAGGKGKAPRPSSAGPPQPPRPASEAAGCSCSMGAMLAPGATATGTALAPSASQPALTPVSYTQFAKEAASRLNAGPKSPGPPGANVDKRQFIRC